MSTTAARLLFWLLSQMPPTPAPYSAGAIHAIVTSPQRQPVARQVVRKMPYSRRLMSARGHF